MRAIAVVAVIIFHLSKSTLPGGYLGVDIFFVLSGFLITSIIWSEMLLGKFTLAHFYERRIRRILPALFLVLIVATCLSIWLLLPADAVDYGKSLIASLAFVANIYFWRDTGYFNPISETKPLLHVWSLGVEEQFYIIFPILLYLIVRFARKRTMLIVLFLVIASLALNYLATAHGAGVPAFFLLPTRAWELGAGALLGLPPTSQLRPSRSIAIVLAAAGLTALANGVLLLVSTAVLTSNLFVIVGTCLLLFAGKNAENPISKILSAKVFSLPGLLSYSLYLWHWPIIVFLKYYLARPLNLMEILVAVFLMSMASFLSWRFIEAPFRREELPIRKVLAVVCAGGAVLAIAGVTIVVGHGFPQRLDPRAAVINEAVGTNYRCGIRDYMPFGASRACSLTLPSRNIADANVALLGNSHAQMYAPVWKSIFAERGLRGLLVPLNGCLPTTTVNISADCAEMAKTNLQSLLGLPAIKTVVIATTWVYGPNDLRTVSGARVDNRDNKALQAGLDALIDTLVQRGRRVVLIGPIPEPGWDVASILSRDLRFGRKLDKPLGESAAAFAARFHDIVAHLQARRDMTLVLPNRLLCDAQTCHYILDGHAMYADNNHLAEGEVRRFVPLFAAAFDAETSRSRR